MNKNVERLYNGIIKENPTFVLMLGMCPTLAVTSSAINGIGMGLSTMVVLVFANLLISLFRKVIPNGVRMPAYIVIVASLVTIVQFILQAYVTSLYNALGVYIPLIVVNCIILGRAESYASKNPVVPSIFDGIGMGLGFTMGLTLIGLFREMLGAGTAFDVAMAELPSFVPWILLVLAIALIAFSVYLVIQKKVTTAGVLIMFLTVVVTLAAVISLLGSNYMPITIFVMAPGAFLVLACLVAVMNIIRVKMEEKGRPLAKPSGCISGDGNCASCAKSGNCSEQAAAEAGKK